MRARPWFALATASLIFTLGACDGLKEALTAHVDVAAKAASQELSVTRLADLLGNAKVPVPITKENAGIVADLWVNYQLLAHAAAVGDSLNDKKAIDRAVEPITKNMRLRKFTDTPVKSVKVDSGGDVQPGRGRLVRGAPHSLWLPARRDTDAKGFGAQEGGKRSLDRQQRELRAVGRQEHERSERKGEGRRSRRLREGADGAAIREWRRGPQAWPDWALAHRVDLRIPHRAAAALGSGRQGRLRAEILGCRCQQGG